MYNPHQQIGFMITLVIIVCAVLFAVFRYNTRETTKILKRCSAEILSCNGEGFKPPQDMWGTTIKAQFIWGEYENTAICISAGPDLKFGTRDDISVERRDLNKTKIATEYIGSKTGEMFKGFMKGIFNQDKH